MTVGRRPVRSAALAPVHGPFDLAALDIGAQGGTFGFVEHAVTVGVVLLHKFRIRAASAGTARAARAASHWPLDFSGLDVRVQCVALGCVEHAVAVRVVLLHQLSIGAARTTTTESTSRRRLNFAGSHICVECGALGFVESAVAVGVVLLEDFLASRTGLRAVGVVLLTAWALDGRPMGAQARTALGGLGLSEETTQRVKDRADR